jgi:hypothetical protein
VALWPEEYVSSDEAVRVPEYLRLGLTDAGLLSLAVAGVELLTDDFDLYKAVADRQAPVHYFTHLWSADWIR